jgi:hypothetical protein
VLKIVHHAWVLDGNIFVLKSVIKVINGEFLFLRLRHSEIFKKFSGVLVTVIDSNFFSINDNILSYHEIINTKEFFIFRSSQHLRLRQYLFSVKILSLRDSRVHLFFFYDLKIMKSKINFT